MNYCISLGPYPVASSIEFRSRPAGFIAILIVRLHDIYFTSVFFIGVTQRFTENIMLS